MYGYFDIKNVCFKKDEKHVFMSYYCRLCYCLWIRGGQFARYLTTFDATIYNLILTLARVDKRPKHFSCQKICHKNKNYFKSDNIALKLTDILILGFAVKVKDDQTDGEKLKVFIFKLIFGRLFKRTINSYSDLYSQSIELIQKMDEIQCSGGTIEEVLNRYGHAMSYAFKYIFGIDEKYLQVIEAIAQWTFFIDMLDDYNDDVKRNAVNSLVYADCKTLEDYFNVHYNELIPIVTRLELTLSECVNAIESEEIEWIVLKKIIDHSIETLVPRILNGEDVKFHYFRETSYNCMKHFQKKKMIKRLAKK